MTEPEGPSQPPQDPPSDPPPQDPPSAAPPPDPPAAPPPPEPPAAPPTASAGGPNTVMIVLSYLWILALVPLLVEKDDKEVQWHAKHGLVLLAAEILFWIAMTILLQVPFLGILGCLVGPLLWLVFLAIHVICIVKGVGGDRFIIPGVSQYADKF